MGPQQGQNGYDVDAIDLTMSSPEPETRPQHRVHTHAQSKPSERVVKQEFGSLHRSVHSSNHVAKRGGVPQHKPHRINPQHIKHIIDSTNSRALRDVVLQLCNTSPALSGALARGLAPHSPWAQALIQKQRNKSQRQPQYNIKTEPKTNEGDAYEHLKRRLGTNGNLQNSPSQDRSCRALAVDKDRDSLRLPPSSQNAAKVKREYRASPTDSDDSTHIVDFPALPPPVPRHEPQCQTLAPSSSSTFSNTRQNADTMSSHRLLAPDFVRNQQQRLCSRCSELFEGSNGECYFHPGHESPARPGDIPQYTCCNSFVGEPGCKVGRHTCERPGTFTNTKRPSPSPGSSQRWKMPRTW